MVKKKKEDVDQVRDEKSHLREEMIKMKEMDVKRKQQMRIEVRIKEQEAKSKREEERRHHEERIREYYEQKAKQEEIEALKAEKLVKKLEKKEREWVEKLRAAQQIQETAYHDLEAALTRQAGDMIEAEAGIGTIEMKFERFSLDDNQDDSNRQSVGSKEYKSGSLSQRDLVRQKSNRGKKPSSS